MEQSPVKLRSQIAVIGAANGFDAEALTDHFEKCFEYVKKLINNIFKKSKDKGVGK